MYVFYKIVNVVQSGFWVTVLPVVVTIVIATYRIVSFFEALKFHKWPIFSFLKILLSRLGLPKRAIIWSN